MYAGAPLAFGVFREKLPDFDRPYRLRAGAVMAPFAFVVANLIILWAGWDTDWRLGIAIVIGYVLLAINRIFHLNPVEPPLELRSAQWLLPYLVVMGIIVRTSAFGPMKNPWFTEWTSLIVVAALSLAVYYWALAVALPADRIRAHLAEVRIVDAGGH
jgi:amino acid transporter